MLSFDEGYAKILTLSERLKTETISIKHAFGRVLAKDVMATRPQPAGDISAMDGYALSGDATKYVLIGEIAAGTNSNLNLERGQCVRIFTGALIPSGADRILIQENAEIDGENIKLKNPVSIGTHIRKKGADFTPDFTLCAPLRLSADHIALIAAMNNAEVIVFKKPKVAIMASGNELLTPGGNPERHHVIASNAYGLKALCDSEGVDATIVDIVKDDLGEIVAAIQNLKEFDIIVTTGGASVGDHDHMPQAITDAGFSLEIHKIAMRPGKPILLGKKGRQILLGLPGNPVSSMVTARIFLTALIKAAQGKVNPILEYEFAILKNVISANEERTHFMRAQITISENENLAEVFNNQDSAMTSIMAKTNGLVVREPNQPKSSSGDKIKFLRIAR